MDRISKLQQKFIVKLFIKELQHILPIVKYINDLINSHNDLFLKSRAEYFDELTEYIQKKEIIACIAQFLKKFYRAYKPDPKVAKKITARMFLSSYVFVGFPEFSLNNSYDNSSNSDIEKDIYAYSKKIHSSLNKLFLSCDCESLRLFAKSVSQFSNVYFVFINHDKIIKINEISTKWLHLENNLTHIKKSTVYNKIDKSNIILQIENDKSQLEELILKIVPYFDVGMLHHLIDLTTAYENTIYKCFWDNLKKDIEDKKYESILSAFNDIKLELLSLKPTSEFKIELDAIISIDSIQIMLDRGCFDFTEILKIVTQLVSVIKELCAPVKIKTVETDWHILLQKIYSNEICGFPSIGVHLFRFILGQVKDIKNDILNSAILLSIGINPLLLK